MLKTNPQYHCWIDRFKHAIEEKDAQQISLLLADLPTLQTREQMEEFLLLSMDAENVICQLRVLLVEKRESLKQTFSL